MIGAYIQPSDARATVEAIRRAEAQGVPAAWLTTSGVIPDASTILGAAAMVTDRILLGTSIIPTWPRHPLAIAQQAIALASLAPGRVRVGIGPSHQPSMESVFGVEWRTPLTNLREYLTVIRTLLQTGGVRFNGRHVRASAEIAGPVDVPILASALRLASFATCGELSDGAISWVCPWDYLRESALPAIRAGAQKARRPPPPLIAHIPVCLTEDRDTVLRVARGFIGPRYGGLPFYASMFAEAGFGDTQSEELSEALIDALVVSGTDAEVQSRLQQILAEGAGEIIAHPLYIDNDRDGYLSHFFDVLAAANVGLPSRR